MLLPMLLSALAAAPPAAGAEASMPHLRRQGSAVQLVVDGKPFLVRGGELGNSSASNPAHLKPSWAKFAELNMNTVLAPVTWDLVEPEEGRFDFSLLDRLIEDARAGGMRLVLLWFGSWKNSMSCYAPAWVKSDPDRFPRARDEGGTPQEILSPFSAENRDTDARAYAALLRHLRESDGRAHTVLMVQVENEIGMIPTARDHGAEADRAYATAVPAELMEHLAAHREKLVPELRALWLGAGGKSAGTWSQVFGPGPAGEEVFMAWHFARYTEAVAAAGKREYPLPVFVNAALIRPGHQPGQYPSGGPLPHLIDVWRAAAPSVDFLAPDIYFQDFADWARRYKRSGNPLFVPEALRSPEASVNVLYALGAHDAMGFSPFGIETIGEPAATHLAASYATGPDEFIIAGTAVTITFAAGAPGKRAGILSAEEGRVVSGRWENVRWLNGDQTHQGRHVRLEPGRFSMQRVRLYRY
jgi:beta-galactosidase GanA